MATTSATSARGRTTLTREQARPKCLHLCYPGAAALSPPEPNEHPSSLFDLPRTVTLQFVSRSPLARGRCASSCPDYSIEVNTATVMPHRASKNGGAPRQEAIAAGGGRGQVGQDRGAAGAQCPRPAAGGHYHVLPQTFLSFFFRLLLSSAILGSPRVIKFLPNLIIKNLQHATPPRRQRP